MAALKLTQFFLLFINSNISQSYSITKEQRMNRRHKQVAPFAKIL
jgi:hypothetical protein